MAEQTFQIQMGALAPSLSKQLKKAGFKFDKKAMDHLQQDSDALSRLLIRGYLNDTIRDRVRYGITKAVETELRRALPKGVDSRG